MIPKNGQTADFNQDNLPIRRNMDEHEESKIYTLTNPIRENKV